MRKPRYNTIEASYDRRQLKRFKNFYDKLTGMQVSKPKPSYSRKQEIRAIVIIQGWWRGQLVRGSYELFQVYNWAATKIQAFYRGQKTRKVLRNRIFALKQKLRQSLTKKPPVVQETLEVKPADEMKVQVEEIKLKKVDESNVVGELKGKLNELEGNHQNMSEMIQTNQTMLKKILDGNNQQPAVSVQNPQMKPVVGQPNAQVGNLNDSIDVNSNVASTNGPGSVQNLGNYSGTMPAKYYGPGFGIPAGLEGDNLYQYHNMVKDTVRDKIFLQYMELAEKVLNKEKGESVPKIAEPIKHEVEMVQIVEPEIVELEEVESVILEDALVENEIHVDQKVIEISL